MDNFYSVTADAKVMRPSDMDPRNRLYVLYDQRFYGVKSSESCPTRLEPTENGYKISFIVPDWIKKEDFRLMIDVKERFLYFYGVVETSEDSHMRPGDQSSSYRALYNAIHIPPDVDMEREFANFDREDRARYVDHVLTLFFEKYNKKFKPSEFDKRRTEAIIDVMYKSVDRILFRVLHEKSSLTERDVTLKQVIYKFVLTGVDPKNLKIYLDKYKRKLTVTGLYDPNKDKKPVVFNAYSDVLSLPKDVVFKSELGYMSKFEDEVLTVYFDRIHNN